VRIEEGQLGAGDGTATVLGEITTGEFPRVDLKLEGQRLPLELFLGEPMASRVHGSVSGSISIGGSLNTAAGVTTRASLKLDSGTMRALPILNTLAVVTGRGRFRDLELSAGSIEFTTGGGRCEVQSFDLRSGSDVAVLGHFVCRDGQFDGMARVGISQELAQRVPAEVQQSLFQRGNDGLLWIDVPLDGPAETLTKEPSDKLAEVYQRAAR
jgi:hypothetical protein